jgi:D-glycero-D-manno-heptose 1,7-bisphosphate phosphatase
MLFSAAQELELNLSRAYLVGDDKRDLVAAHRAGVQGILVRTGKGRRFRVPDDFDPEEAPQYVATDLPAAVDWILQRRSDGDGCGGEKGT